VKRERAGIGGVSWYYELWEYIGALLVAIMRVSETELVALRASSRELLLTMSRNQKLHTATTANNLVGGPFENNYCLNLKDIIMSTRKSGLQREVLALYRRYFIIYSLFFPFKILFIYSALRMVRTKPPITRPKFLLFVRYTFRTKASSVSARDVAAIEHLLRKGRRQIEGLEEEGVKDYWVSEDMQQWDASTRKRTT
jgi:succinate dehydrogenase assembly factor 1